MSSDANKRGEVVERRKRQRFMARRDGRCVFSVIIDGQRLPALDLSLEGFAVPATTPPEANRVFAFVLQREGREGDIRGRARAVNHVSAVEGGQAGCLFDHFEGDGLGRLEAWLRDHVFEEAAIPITRDEAGLIVNGPSLV